MGSVPGQGAKMLHASGPKNQNMEQKQYCNKFNKDFKKNGDIKKKNPLHLHIALSFFKVRLHFLVC